MTPRQVRADELAQAHATLRAVIEGYEYERAQQSADTETTGSRQRRVSDAGKPSIVSARWNVAR
jgi:hypothetical protein